MRNNQKPYRKDERDKDALIARMNVLSRAVEWGIHRDMEIDEVLELAERFYKWVMKLENTKMESSTKKNGSNGRPASPKQIAFIRRLLQNAPEELKKEVEDALENGITSHEASAIIEELKKEAQK